MPRLFIGCISGTSIDGLDIALVDVETKPTITASTTVLFPEILERDLRQLLRPGPNEIFQLGLTNARLGEFIGTAILGFLKDNDLDAGDITAIGSHGQTVRHHPNADPGFSLQIGSGSHIAEITGIDTISDFRSRDLASGGEGAPLVPSFHRMLFHPYEHDQVILNIGGIANITILYSNDQQPYFGFDTGPGNALLDAWIQDSKHTRYDPNGDWSASGRVSMKFLEKLLDDSYFSLEPPKSTGKENFNLDYIKRNLDDLPKMKPADVQSTLCEFTAITAAKAIERWGPDSARVVVCGGGRLNSDLMQRLHTHLDAQQVIRSEEINVDGDSLEAGAFAWLARCFIDGMPGNVPSVTGASGERVLGCLYPSGASA
tara:strand:+ start:3342 stop:4460 length:1119 start_codon:yes stop_codon:yes gene_type:complete